MSKKINKDITDSEELFKRLETGDDSGLDDFEKEAFEGFSSLNDVKLSEKLHTGLNEKITEVYFKPASKKNNLAFFSMAAGLLLMVGVSIFFYQYLSSEKKDMALNTGATTNEMQVMENAPPPPPKTEEKANKLDEAEQKEPLKTAAVVVDKVAQSQAPKDLRQDDREKGIVNIETKKSSGESIADDNSNATSIMENNPGSGADGKLKKQEEGQGNNRSNTGPSGNLAGGAGGKDMDKKQRFGNDKSGKGDDLAKNKSPETKNMEDITPSEKDMDAESETKPTTDYKSKEETVATKRKEDESTNDLSKVSSRDASKKRSKKAEAPSASANTSPAKASEAPAFYTLNFSNTKYNSAQDYIKSEIDKDEVLKEKVKDFKAKLIVDETGKVIKVNFITDFKKCADCDERLGKILLNMPGWNSIPEKDKAQNREAVLSYPK